MNETNNVMEMLTQIANKLGVAVEYLWEVVVRQAQVDGITRLILAVVCLVVSICIFKYVPKRTRELKARYEELKEDRIKNGTGFGRSHVISSFEEDSAKSAYEEAPTFLYTFAVICGILSVIFLIIGIRPLFNPDYFAIKDIMYMFNGLM